MFENIATELNDKGYFTRHCMVDDHEALEVAHPNKDVMSGMIMSELRRPDIIPMQVMSARMWYVRLRFK